MCQSTLQAGRVLKGQPRYGDTLIFGDRSVAELVKHVGGYPVSDEKPQGEIHSFTFLAYCATLIHLLKVQLEGNMFYWSSFRSLSQNQGTPGNKCGTGSFDRIHLQHATVRQKTDAPQKKVAVSPLVFL